jgi:hypothetical protein
MDLSTKTVTAVSMTFSHAQSIMEQPLHDYIILSDEWYMIWIYLNSVLSLKFVLWMQMGI